MIDLEDFKETFKEELEDIDNDNLDQSTYELFQCEANYNNGDVYSGQVVYDWGEIRTMLEEYIKGE